MECISALLFCLPPPKATPAPNAHQDEKTVITAQPVPYSDDAAAQFVETLRQANTIDKDLEDRLNRIVSTNGWTQSLAEAILDGIEKIIKKGGRMAAAMDDTIQKATDVAKEFAKEHPYYTALIAGTTLIALGVLAMMAPAWVLRAGLGFGSKGPRPNSFASRWMSEIARKYGQVSRGSIYSFLQRLGMTWK